MSEQKILCLTDRPQLKLRSLCVTCVTWQALADNKSVEMHCAIILGAGCIIPSMKRCTYVPEFDVRGSVHHSIIHIEIANKMQ